ncbi:unnamed protein product [Allacma fusca]|uniref:Uncharacterized protein n=1 Tax=Allacma fusca TaxID=39272 RepID=A0A8J2Q0N1_9HEXA|nr:unnamed protein product [Allacma fusca]
MSELKSRDYPPSAVIPPVFNAPPNPPNPSLAQSDNQDETLEEHLESQQLHPEDSSDESFDSEDDPWDDNCCYDGGDAEGAVGVGIPSEIPAVGISEYLGKFSATSTNQTCLSTLTQMVDKIKESMDMEGRFVPIDGLTSSETKRQGFHAYLKSSGLLGVIGTIILGLYELEEYPPKEKLPEYIAQLLDYSSKLKGDIAESSAYNQMLDIRLQRLQVENDWLHRRLDDFECSETPIEYLDPDFFDPKLNEQRKFPDPLPIKRRQFKNLRKPTAAQFQEQKDILQEAIEEFDATEKINATVSQKISRKFEKVGDADIPKGN